MTDVLDKCESFETVQAALSGVPGAEGASKRAEAYRRFFGHFGRDVYVGAGCTFSHPERIMLEDGARIDDQSVIHGSGGVRIGRHARIGPRCFMYSSNHEVPDEAKAFCDCGAEYAAVDLADNVLLSANVSILPGAHVGSGCFVACGAVVPRGTYSEESVIKGTPAVAVLSSPSKSFISTPIVELVAPDNGGWIEVAHAIVEMIASPQVTARVISDEQTPSIRQSLAIGPIGWGFEGEASGIEVAAGIHEVVRRWVPSGRPTIDARAMRRLFYLSWKRGHKAPVGERPLEDAEQHLAIRLLRARGCPELSTWLQEEMGASEKVLRDKALGAAFLSAARVSKGCRDKVAARQYSALKPEVFEGHPELLIALALSMPGDEPEAMLVSGIRDVLETAETVTRWSRAAAAALCLGLEDEVEQSLHRGLEGWWVDSKTGSILESKGGQAFYTGHLFATIVAAMKGYTDESLLPILSSEQVPILRRRAGESGISIADLVRVSTAALLIPYKEDSQLELEASCYAVDVLDIETCWTSIARDLVHSVGMPFIHLLPWPHGYDGAVSVRFDIDRPLADDHAREYLQLQQSKTGRPCGSWYAIDDRAGGAALHAWLPRYWQECGVHALHGDDARTGQGVTCHSSPDSAYWLGTPTIEAAERCGASYAEMLASQFGLPRQGLLSSDDGTLRRTDLHLLPLHFPLEGSTIDTDLSYFERRAVEFNRLLAQGGHIIVGTHPDLPASLLEHLFEQEPFPRYWPATVAEAVDRVARVRAPGAIQARFDEEGEWFLRAKNHVVDLAIEVIPPGEPPIGLVLHLPPGHERQLKLLSPAAFAGQSL